VAHRFSDPVLLDAGHDVARFDCGTEALNIWLTKHALQAVGAGSARVFVTVDAEQDRVVGYHALSAASVIHAEATDRAKKGMPRHPIPAGLLARLAIDQSVQGNGLGAWLLRDAMIRTLSAAEEVGIRVMLVHAIDDAAAAFYAKFGFEPSPTDPLNLQMLIKDIRAAVNELSV
jgi:GNAT superfamily N-acetyltransferase